MKLIVAATVGLAMLAGAAGAVEGWNHSPDYPNGVSGYWDKVATRMPTGAPVYVAPECTFTSANAFKKADGSAAAPGPASFGQGGRIPHGFSPVRAVRCGGYGDGSSLTATQSEIRDPGAVKALVSAYRTTHDREYVSSEIYCPAIAEGDPDIALVDAHGVAVIPGAPRDTCDLLIPSIITATRDELWTVTRSVPVH